MSPTDKPTSVASSPADSLEPLLGATFCLMTHWMSHRDACVANKIVSNLDALAASQNASDNFKLICCRLRDRWRSMQTPVCPATPVQTGRYLH